MSRRFLLPLLACTLLLSFAVSARAQDKAHAMQGSAGFDPKRDPVADLQAAMKRAKAEHKRILLDVGGEWCIWCHVLNRTMEGDATLSKLLADHYVTVKVNYSDENENKPFLAGYPQIDGYPHLFVLDAEGKLLRSQDTSELESGKGYNLEKVAAFLRQWGR